MNINELIQQGTYQRNYRVCTTPYSLNPAIAFAMNQLAGLDEGDQILDPCCGTGTILIERQLLKPAECLGVDINPKNLECAKQNIAAARFHADTFQVQHENTSKPSLRDHKVAKQSQSSVIPTKAGIYLKHGNILDQKFPPNSFTKIISNLPYGIHSGSRESNKKLYRFLADEAINWLKPGGKTVFLTNAKSLLRNSFAFNPNWQLLEEIPIKIGGMTLAIFMYQKGRA